MAPYEALYGQKYRSPLNWDIEEWRCTKDGKTRSIKLDIIQEAIDKVHAIKQRIQSAQSRQRSYANKRRKDLVFTVGDQVLLKISPRKGIRRAGKKGKLQPRFVGPFEMKRIGPIVYQLQLPRSLSGIHNTFHVSQLRKCFTDSTPIVDPVHVNLESDLTYEEQPVRILDQKIKELRRRKVQLVKVLWRNQNIEEATWEREEDIRQQYPELFESGD
ncbi:uncharacterized protein [Primulina huaijiensis]|uniref:uncharacterized protein n=1 Tax=Primulina huaijiensis TaxID=1492673 RepID=UPI003CC6F0E9